MGTRLKALDLAFLALETRKTPVNVAGLVVFEIPKDYRGNFVRDLLGKLETCQPGPPFNQKLSTGGPVALREWITDTHFDFDYHVRHSALPKPGSMDDLFALASRLHSRVMDRERPLWEFHLIEGLKGRRFAMYMKMHHAAIDGMGGIAILESCFSEDPQAPVRAPWQGSPPKARAANPGGLLSFLDSAAKQVLNQAQLGVELGRMVVGHSMKPLGLKPDDSPIPFSAPNSCFNVPISGARRFHAETLSLVELKALGKQAGATVNDMVLAICAGALRAYLLEKDALPERTLVATVPVSVRQINRTGNQITYVTAKLGTDLADPMARLRAIGASTVQAKQEVASVSPAAATSFAVMAQGLVAVLNRFHLTDLLPPPANVTISNIPGPRKALYFGGARMLADYPLSVLVDGQALNITVISYADAIDFGLMACRDTVPDVDHLGELMRAAIAELKAAIEKPQPIRKPKLKSTSRLRKRSQP